MLRPLLWPLMHLLGTSATPLLWPRHRTACRRRHPWYLSDLWTPIPKRAHFYRQLSSFPPPQPFLFYAGKRLNYIWSWSGSIWPVVLRLMCFKNFFVTTLHLHFFAIKTPPLRPYIALVLPKYCFFKSSSTSEVQRCIRRGAEVASAGRFWKSLCSRKKKIGRVSRGGQLARAGAMRLSFRALYTVVYWYIIKNQRIKSRRRIIISSTATGARHLA